MSLDNKQIIANYHHSVWDEKRLDAISDFCSEEAEFKSPLRFVQGPNAFKEVIKVWLDTFPDMKVTFEEPVAEGDTVVVSYTSQATCKKPFLGLEGIGKTVCYQGVSFYKIRDGKIYDYFGLVDLDSLKSQLLD